MKIINFKKKYMFQKKCYNHGCQINIACSLYDNNILDNSEDIKPKITYDEFGKPKLICDFFQPHNVKTLIRRHKINSCWNIHNSKIALDIVNEFGNNRKQKLMKKLQKII